MSNQPYARQIALPDGTPVETRPLLAEDADRLAGYFLGLSAATRSCYGPHPFDRETAEWLCDGAEPLNPSRFVALLGTGDARQIVGYMILTRDISPSDMRRYAEHGLALQVATCASFAPSIADAFQDRGLGTQMARHVLGCAPAMGLTQVILMGGVLHRNPRAKHLYEKLGFRQVGQFYSTNRPDELNYDMILEVEPSGERAPNCPARPLA